MLFGIYAIRNPPHLFDRQLLKDRRARVSMGASVPDYLLHAFRESLKDRLLPINRVFSCPLILGNHYGLLRKSLKEDCGLSSIIEAETRLSFFQKFGGYQIVADEEALPFVDETFDLVISCLSLHFVNDLPGALLQIRKLLKPDGLFLAGVLGGGTLSELRMSWLLAETEHGKGVSPRIIPFADVQDYGYLMQRAGFALPVVDTETLKVTYNSSLNLMLDIRAMGAGNVLMERSRRPITRSLLKRVQEIYAERFADENGRVFANFELIVMTGWSPHHTQQKPLPPGSAKIRLSDALKNLK